MEGRTNSPVAPEYDPDALFWRTSMGQAISSFGVNRTSPKQTSPDEDVKTPIFLKNLKFLKSHIINVNAI